MRTTPARTKNHGSLLTSNHTAIYKFWIIRLADCFYAEVSKLISNCVMNIQREEKIKIFYEELIKALVSRKALYFIIFHFSIWEVKRQLKISTWHDHWLIESRYSFSNASFVYLMMYRFVDFMTTDDLKTRNLLSFSLFPYSLFDLRRSYPLYSCFAVKKSSYYYLLNMNFSLWHFPFSSQPISLGGIRGVF